jgi:hypothetical protein
MGEIIYDIDLKPTFWDKLNVDNIPFEHFLSVFNKNLIKSPRYIPQEDVKIWIDELIINCPLYRDFILNFYKFKFNTDDNGEFYKQNDRRNFYSFYYDFFHEMIQQLIYYYDLDLKLFLSIFNNMFSYYIDDFRNNSNNGLIHFSVYTGINLNNLDKDGIVTLLQMLSKYPFFPGAISFDLDGPCFYNNVETVFLQYWYEEQTFLSNSENKHKERIFADKRQLTWFDFDTEVIKELSHETIKKMILMLFEVGITEYKQFNIQEYGRQYAEEILREKKIYKTIDEIFLDDRINTCLETVKELRAKDNKHGFITSEFKKGVCSVIENIMDECKLVEMIIRLNELIITYINSNSEEDYDKINNSLDIMEPKIGKRVNMKDDFTTLNHHTYCLFGQICVSVIDNPDIKPILKSIAEKFIKNSRQCKRYYKCLEDKEKKCYVYCEHKTIHYYTFTKWWYLYTVLIEKFYDKKLSDMTLSEYYQNTFQVWYPKASYCDKCYTQYKNLEEIVNNSTKGLISYIPDKNEDLLAQKFLIVVMKSKIPKYRAIYNENCDIPIYSEDGNLLKAYNNHKKEIENKVSNVKSALHDFLKNIRQELEQTIKLFD